jgi:glutathione S-transferase
MAAGPLSWSDLEALVESSPLRWGQERSNGATNAQADWRLFGHSQGEVRVTLFRDHHAWCPYCQKVWLWLEERRIPYRVRKVTMFCYGEKEPWYKRLVPSGMLPALELDGVIITESDTILEALEQTFGSLGAGMAEPAVLTAAPAGAAVVPSLVPVALPCPSPGQRRRCPWHIPALGRGDGAGPHRPAWRFSPRA